MGMKFYCKALINLRSGAWKAISRRITKLGGSDWDKKKVQEVAKDFHTKYSQRKKDGKFHPYYGVIVYQLEKRFRELRSG